MSAQIIEFAPYLRAKRLEAEWVDLGLDALPPPTAAELIELARLLGRPYEPPEVP